MSQDLLVLFLALPVTHYVPTGKSLKGAFAEPGSSLHYFTSSDWKRVGRPGGEGMFSLLSILFFHFIENLL